jgi:ABC-type glycerol-3-phosphate transport system permease component
MSASSSGTRTVRLVITYAILSLGALAVLVPVLWMLSTALKSDREIFSVPPRWIPDSFSLSAATRVWSAYPFFSYFRNSLLVVISSAFISVIFSSLAGYGLSRFKFPGRGSFLTFLLMSQMFPSIMLLVPYYKIFQTTGLINTHSALIVTYVSFTIPFCTWMMYGYFQGIPTELDESAAIDGAGRMQTFTRVVMPLALPGVAAISIYSFVTAWNEYMFALVLTQSEAMKTLAVGIGQMVGQYRISWNDLMASSLYASIPLLIVFVFLQRYLVSGLTAGAVKG